MRRRIDSRVIPDPSRQADWHRAGDRQVTRFRLGLVISPVPDQWRDNARQPWRVLFPDFDWPKTNQQ